MGGDEPFDGALFFCVGIQEAVPLCSLLRLIHPMFPKCGWKSSCSALPSCPSPAAEAHCLLLLHAMSWASSIVAGPRRWEVIKLAYPPGRELINSIFSPHRGAEAHTNSLNPSLASLLSLRMSGFFFIFFLLFLSSFFFSFFFLILYFKKKMKIISTKLEFELTVLCVRDLFIMIWYCSGQHAH